MRDGRSPFTDPAAVATYGTDARRKVPGLDDLHRMVTLLLAERAPERAHLLVVGAGGGLELRAMADARAGWRFTGVDPSPAMLDLAREAISPFAGRVDLVAGTVDQAPAGPFDGATCLLTLHFLDRAERLRTLREIHRRLKPEARLVQELRARRWPSVCRCSARTPKKNCCARPVTRMWNCSTPLFRSAAGSRRQLRHDPRCVAAREVPCPAPLKEHEQ